MDERLSLLFIGAHPDDETLGAGPVLARYAAEGVTVAALAATRGQLGWSGAPDRYPGPEALGRIREAELRCAAAVLGLEEFAVFDFMDGALSDVDQRNLVTPIVAYVRRLRPQVVITFDPFGNYGHPDHIAISQATLAALVAAADGTYTDELGNAPHRVAKLYYVIDTPAIVACFEPLIGILSIDVDGVTRPAMPWPEWAVTTWVDTAAFRDRVIRAAECHASQLDGLRLRPFMMAEGRQWLWSTLPLFRAYSLVDLPRGPETDLFSGLR